MAASWPRPSFELDSRLALDHGLERLQPFRAPVTGLKDVGELRYAQQLGGSGLDVLDLAILGQAEVGVHLRVIFVAGEDERFAGLQDRVPGQAERRPA